MPRLCKCLSVNVLRANMGQFIVDGHPENIAVAPGATVAEAFEAARDLVLSRGHVVVEVCLGDNPIQWGDGSSLWGDGFDPNAVLELHTAEPVRLCVGLLETAAQAMAPAAESHRAIAESLRTGPVEDATNALVDLLPCWQSLQDTVTGVFGLLDIDPAADEWKSIGTRILGLATALHQRLGELKEAADGQDFVLVADLLEYELAPLAEQWQTALADFGIEIERRFSKEGASNP